MAKNTKSGSVVFNLLTIAILLATLVVAAVYALIFINPELPFNPFPPPTDFATQDFSPTATDTPAVYLPPTWTATVDPSTATPTETSTPRPSSTPTEEPPPSATATVDVNATVTPFVPSFVLQTNSPSYTANFANGQECSWHGIAGQVFDLNGAPLKGITVHLSGTLEGQDIDLYTQTGSETAYGPAGYEFVVGDAPVTSTNTLWIQIYDEDEELALSEKIFLSTYNNCERNLILVNWNQIAQ